ncbi:hypothetical protein BGW80DRAFT_1307382, partial [Lactifluus volemus]
TRTHWQRPVRPRPPQRATCYGVRGLPQSLFLSRILARKRSTPRSINRTRNISAYQEFLTGATVMALYPDTSCFYLRK